MNQVSAEISDCQDNNCHSSCSKCQNQISQNYVRTVSYMNSFCSSCDRNEHKIFNTNICECFLGYYMEKTINPNTCQLCNSKCKTCSDATTCITCYPEQNRIYNDYQCQCKEGYFDNEYDSSCIKCITLCKSCLYKQNHCIDCHPEQYRILSKENKCICQNGYYDNQNDVCLKCNDNCYSCTNYYTCTSCNEFDFRKLDVLNKICICQLGYYDTVIFRNLIINFFKDFYLILQLFFSVSKIQNYNKQFHKKIKCNNEQTCLPCYYTCSKCNNQNLPSQCTLCPKTRQKSSNNLDTFECQCRKGYFDDGYLECLPCINLINPPISHYCYSFCGDLIVQWNEECDDGNLDQRDGCNQCFLQNNNCKENVCLKCYTKFKKILQFFIFIHLFL